MESIKSIRINTRDLFRRSCTQVDNLSIQEEGLQLEKMQIYEYDREVINDPTCDFQDMAVDECDTLFLLEKNRILVFSPETGLFQELGCPAGTLPVQLTDPTSIAVDTQNIYIGDGSQVIALARSNLQVRFVLSLAPDGTSIGKVLDLAVGPGPVLSILAKERSTWVFQVNQGGEYVGHEISLEDLLNVRTTGKRPLRPTDLAIDHEGDLYVLDEISGEDSGQKRDNLYIINPTDRSIEGVSLPWIPKGLAIDPNGQIFIGVSEKEGTKERTIYRIYGDSFQDSTSLWSYPGARPYQGAVRRLITDSQGNLYVVGLEGHDHATFHGSRLTLFLIRDIYRPDTMGVYTGSYISEPIDSTVLKTVWHRFLLSGTFPEGTRVDLYYIIADNLQDLPADVDTSWADAFPVAAALQGTSQRDALFLSGKQGRYLKFKITLTGNETLSPVITSLELFFPRASYLQYLPAIYRDDTANSEFFERYLSIFESMNAEADDVILRLPGYFSPARVPLEFLSWLGSWLALSLDEGWPEEMQRTLMAKAMGLYRKRGTRAGLEEMIELYTGKKPFIVENFRINGEPCASVITPCEETGFLFLPPSTATVSIPVFRWAKVTGEDAQKIREYLIQKLKLEWVKDAEIGQDASSITIAKSPGNIIEITRPASEDPWIKVLFNRNEVRELALIVKEECGEITVCEEVALRDVLFGAERFCFCVLLEGSDGDECTNTVTRRIIEDQKPAHTCYGLRILEPWFYLDMHTYLGVNTTLTRQSFVIGTQSVITRDTVIDDAEGYGQVQIHSRIGIDGKLT